MLQNHFYDGITYALQELGVPKVVSETKWSNLSTKEKIEILHEEVKSSQSNTRSLKKVMSGLVARIGEMRRYLGMNQAS